MADQRSAIEKAMDAKIGPPLYYCDDCKRAVRVTIVEGAEPIIERPCKEQCGHAIIAPRKSILAGEGGLNFKDRCTVKWWQIAAAITGRSV